MTDILKQVSLAGKYKAEARLANLAAKEMAKHCDKRIAAALKAFKQIRKIANGPGNRYVVIDKVYWLAVEAANAIEGKEEIAHPTAAIPSQNGNTP